MIDWPNKVVRLVSLPVIPEIFKKETWYLFNIETDPGEEHDLKDDDSARLGAMRDELLALSRRREIEHVTDEEWDEFGGKIVRDPRAVSASDTEERFDEATEELDI